MSLKIVLYKATLLFILLSKSCNCFLPILPVPSSNPDDVHFLYFNKAWPNLTHKEIKLGSTATIPQEVRGGRVLVVFCHGFGDGPTDDDGGAIAIKAYLDSNLEVNVIAVDWLKLCFELHTQNLLNPVGMFKIYTKCISNLDIVAKRAGEFILWFESLGIADLEHVHVIGWSLGGQLAGRVGREYQKLRTDGRKIARVTGLDPAGPLFNLPPLYLQQATRSGDATFVDALHSNAGVQGEFLATADADVYLNGITLQPEFCSIQDEELAAECSHSFAVKVFAASFRRAIFGCQFDSYFIEGKCVNPTYVGLYMPSSARGKFYAKVDGV